LVSENIALGCSIFAARQLREQKQFIISAFAQFEHGPPFRPAPSQILMRGCPAGVIACVPLLDSWNIPSRLTGPIAQSGCYQGDICELLELWRQQLNSNEQNDVQILGYGTADFIARVTAWSRSCRIGLKAALIPAD
jgi:hypothetical protein